MNERILIVEDEPGLRQSLTDCLNVHQYSVESRKDGQAGFERASQSGFDLIILDIMLPSMNGFDVCRSLRQLGVSTPVLMLTARGTLSDKVAGLRQGADDYLTKPFEMEELLARVEALIRRSMTTAAQKDVYDINGIQIDFRNSRIVRNGRTTDLSEREAHLLRYLIERRGQVLTRRELLRAVWGYDFTPFSRTVDVHIVWLRQKLEDDPRQPRLIVTVHGQGYRFAT
jgi:two-component system alkaline phosphatase synthesis response regulator PhoP